MKLKNVLVLAFLTVTLIPIIIVSLLLYQSGFNLSKESYTRNLIESINVQEDYILQTLENNMIADYRLTNRLNTLSSNKDRSPEAQWENLLSAFQSYLETSEDKITVCMLLDKDGAPIYTVGEKAVLDMIAAQLPELPNLTKQTMMEFKLEQETYSLGIVTPIWSADHTYVGSLISVYDKSYIFKIISSYYKIADTSTYICRENGEVVKFRKLSDEKQNAVVEQFLYETTFTSEGIIDTRIGNVPLSGYYKNIRNSPWYVVGFVDHQLIYSFTTQFIWVYILIIIGVLIVDILLSFYFSRRVVAPINGLIKVMEGYQNSLNSNDLQYREKNSYFETQYLWTKFLSLMKAILLVQHNFEGIYQLYQSNDMEDTNIDLDVKNQTAFSNKEAFRKLMNTMDIAVGDCIVEKFTKCFCKKDQLMLMNIFEKMRDEHLSVACEAEVYTPHLDQKWFHTLVVPMYEGDRLSRLFIQLRDISRLKKQEFYSIEQARRDSLTGLYNRYGFTENVNEVLRREKTTSALHCLLFMDMNYFKMVNDNLGHKAGDDLLCSVGSILLDSVGPYDIVSRFGGDEFAVFLPHATSESIAEMKENLSKRLVFPFATEKVSFVVSVSIGFSTWSSTAPSTFENLLQQADDAMYQAKRKFKDAMEMSK